MMKHTVGAVGVALVALCFAACAKKPVVELKAPGGEWVSLFNGKDLDDWTVKIAGHDVGDNYAKTFRVEDGLLKVSYDGYQGFGGRFGSLFHKRKLGHYWLRAEYRFVGGLTAGAPSWAFKNSGIQLHSQAPSTMRKTQEFPVSVEFDIVGRGSWNHHPTGDVCENGTRVTIDGRLLTDKCSKSSDVALSGDEWTTVVAEVQGAKLVRQAVNGVMTVQYTDLVLDGQDPDARQFVGPNGDVSLSSGFISLQSNGQPIEFRRVEVLPLD